MFRILRCCHYGMYQHFKAVAEATSLPIILYNIPGRCGVNMTPELIARLAQILLCRILRCCHYRFQLNVLPSVLLRRNLPLRYLKMELPLRLIICQKMKYMLDAFVGIWAATKRSICGLLSTSCAKVLQPTLYKLLKNCCVKTYFNFCVS